MSHDPSQRTAFEKAVLGLSIVFISIFLAGTRACQEDYELCGDCNVPTATVESDDTNAPRRTRTPTQTATNTSEPTETPEPTEIPEDDGEVGGNSTATDLLTELSALNDDEDKKDSKDTSTAASSRKGSSGAKSSNWLGKAYDESSDDGLGIDSDGDGYADWLENETGSDDNNASSTPNPTHLRITLSSRFNRIDDDMDGLTNQEEIKLKTNPASADTDSDGIIDGIEANSGFDPLNSRIRPGDSDKDGVGDDLENELKMNPGLADSDTDGLKDSVEVAIGSNALNPDTDGDGVLDGKEFTLGFDPTRKE